MSEVIDPAAGAALGAIQGLTEFLPVSSSGHIAIGALLFGVEDPPLSFSVLLHAGTLIATIVFFRRELTELFVETAKGVRTPRSYLASDPGRTTMGVLVASVPTAVAGLLLQDHVESLGHLPWVVGGCLLFSAAAVASTRWSGGDRLSPSTAQALLIGLAQSVAILPGVSRSGSTIAAAMLLGVTGAAAFRFSFLLSLPAVAGAVVLSLGEEGALDGLGPGVFLGVAIAMVVGYISLVALRRIVDEGRLAAFAVYLVPLGVGLILWDLTR